LSTAILIERFTSDFILNTGFAGGMDRSLCIWDIVISTESIFCDVDATVFNYTLEQVPEMLASCQVDDKYSELALKVFVELDTSQKIICGFNPYSRFFYE